MQNEQIELFTQLELGLAWYNDNSDKAKLPQLLKWQDEMAIRSYYLAEIIGDAKGEYNNKYFIRKLTVARKELTLIKADNPIGRAKAEALVQAEPQIKAELEAETYAIKCDILLRQVNKILQASQQRISFEKEEWSRTKSQQQT